MKQRLNSIYSMGLLVAGLSLSSAMPAKADPYDHHGWHGDIHHVERHDLPRWRAGYWNHGWHEGRAGWWWVVDGGWYFYSAPVYPYPDPYAPPVVVVEPNNPAPAFQAPVVQASPPAPASQNWYYCEASHTYYPYVASCASGWKIVPASPAGTSLQS